MRKKAKENLIKIKYNQIKTGSDVAEQRLAGAFALLFKEVILKINFGNLGIKSRILDVSK